MRLARWSTALSLPLAAACEIPTAPRLPEGAQRFAPPAVYDLWWSMTRECSGGSGSLADVRWYVVPRAVVVDGERYDGFWYGSGNRIVLAEYARLDGALIRHEMLHELLGTGYHLREAFLGRCGGVVACVDDCLEDAGRLPPADPGVARTGPDALEVNIVLNPRVPSRTQYGGYFTVTVTARNPLAYPVVVTLPASGDAGPSVSFEYRVEEAGGYMTNNDRAWDDGVTRFAPGETKRRVFDFYITDGGGFSSRGGLGPGTYRFRGAYGGRWAATTPTITLSAH